MRRLHGRTLYLCVLDRAGQVDSHRNLPGKKDAVLGALAPSREDLSVDCECIFCWYWLADLCDGAEVAVASVSRPKLKPVRETRTR